MHHIFDVDPDVVIGMNLDVYIGMDLDVRVLTLILSPNLNFRAAYSGEIAVPIVSDPLHLKSGLSFQSRSGMSQKYPRQHTARVHMRTKQE